MRTLRLSLAGTVILVVLGGLATTTAAQSDEAGAVERVLFVGNSFTYVNGGVDQYVANLVASEEQPRAFEVDASTVSNATLRRHYQIAQRSLTGGVLGRIRDGDYDAVVLQGDIPEDIMESVEPFLEYARLFDEEIAATGARTVLFMTWPDRSQDWVGLDDIVAAHRQLETELGASVAPVSVAMANALAERPSLAMLRADGHETVAGTYLAAATIYATLFDQSPEGLGYPPDDLTEEDAAFLQSVAWQTVEEWQQPESGA